MYIDHRYEVLESLGTGAWAKVFKVRDIRSGALYSLKLFQYLSSEALYARFSAEEMHRITMIEHPNLSHVVDFGHVADHIYYISEFFDGSTLANFRFSKGKLDLIYDLVVQCAYALHALHNKKILHKDLKPENILYRLNGRNLEVKLIDYGFSKTDIEKESHMVSGSLPYIAPEVYLGKKVGPESDFYSLGAVLYKLCTGTVPINLDQISALINGSQQYFIPNYPSDLNPDVTPALEQLILTLLESNPENRFHSAKEIIAHVNRISQRSYPFSVSWTLKNTLRYNSHIVREQYAHQLLDYLPAVRNSNGKIISLIGGDGLGKEHILSLFRYHLLGGEFFLFDYTCTKTEHDAFFALIKEYFRSLTPEEIESLASIKKMSARLKQFLLDDKEHVRRSYQSQEDLRSDFAAARNVLTELSQTKPIIFIIRDFQFVHHHTIDFINHISQFLHTQRVLVVLTCNEFNKVRMIDNTIMLHIPLLNEDESREYMVRLLDTEIPDEFAQSLYLRSAGNPRFIREILLELAQKKLITHTESWRFPQNLDDFRLPSKIMQSIQSRMNRISQKNSEYLQKLAVVYTPISRDLIAYILKLNDQEQYSLLNEAYYNEIFSKRGKHYYYTYPEARKIYIDKATQASYVAISRRVLKYYDQHNVDSAETCLGLIENAKLAEDPVSERKYYLRLYQLENDDFNQEAAYDAIINVLMIDFALGPPSSKTPGKLSISEDDIIRDLRMFHEKIEAIGFVHQSGFVEDNADKIPELFEKYFVLGTLKMLAEDRIEARKHFEKAKSLAITGRQRVLAWLYLSRIAEVLDPQQVIYYLNQIDQSELSLDLRIMFVDRLAVYWASQKDNGRAIKTIEDFLTEIPPDHDYQALINLASMHNNLGVFYSDQKNIEEADEHLNIALGIWKRHNIKRFLGLIHNNIADLLLKQGFTTKAQEYSRLGYQYSKDLELTSNEALALLNQGEAYIKMGQFQIAEERLIAAQRLQESKNSSRYLSSIQRNLALAKSKILGFGHYYQFISENEPELIQGHIREINPLVKTYFYYLHEVGNLKKLRNLIRKNVQINYKHIHEEEFYHNILSLSALSSGDYNLALSELRQAMFFAGEINNNYAIAVFNVLQTQCYHGLKDYAKARELAASALISIRENQYLYWETKLQIILIKLDMMNPEEPLRGILRRVNEILTLCVANQYYQLEVETRQIKIQILVELGIDNRAQHEYQVYRTLLEDVTADIDPEDRENYLHASHHNLKSIKKFTAIPLASRRKDLRNRWNELLYDIANVNSIDRVKFLIEKGIDRVICPASFKLMVYSELLSNPYCFHCANCSEDEMIPGALKPVIEKAFEMDTIMGTEFEGRHIQIIPLLSGSKRIGYLLMSDAGELDYTRNELTLMRNIKQHLTALIIRVNDYSQITLRMEKMNELMGISHELMGIVDMADLERETVSAAIDFTNATRGFLIRWDAEGNNLYRVQLDIKKAPLATVAGVSKSALSLCQSSMKPVFSYNAQEDQTFKNAISVMDYGIHSIYCCPIIVDDQPQAWLYLDNMGESSRKMYINEDVLSLFQAQIGIAFKNAGQYEAVIKKSHEVNELDALKNEFMAIVSHELNTPLAIMQGYVSRLKRRLYTDDEEYQELILKLEAAVRKLIISAEDIRIMNEYNLSNQLSKAPFEIKEILELVHQEVGILARNRKLFYKMEVEDNLPPVNANWEAVHRMIHNVVVNAVRFTADFGEILIGARRSVYPSEKINNRESLVIYVQDNGIGIPDYQQKKIFRKFYELNEIYAHKAGTVEYRSSGLGLGLATAKRIIDLHGGIITLSSKEQEGTTVFMILPFKDSSTKGYTSQ